MCLLFLQELQLPDAGDLLDLLSPGRILNAIFILVAAFVVVRLSSAFFETLSRRGPRSRFFFKMLETVVRFGAWIAAAALVIVALALPPETTLAILASVGIALGLGAQDLVKNLIGGVIILIDRPYQLGDRVKIGDAYGEIDHIGLLSTKLTTPDDTRVTIPNNAILSGMAWNSNSGVLDCQVVTDLFLPIDTDPTEAVEIGYESAYSSPWVLLTKPVVVLLEDSFQERPYLRLRIKAYVYDHRYEPRFQSDVTIRAKAEFLRRGWLRPWRTETAGP
jgi:small-conductance mechanosensitive channel